MTDINQRYKITQLFYFLVFIIVVSCTSLTDGLSADDDGFTIFIRNYTDKEYRGCKFYMGAFDSNNNFIAVDSLVYPNLKIYKNTEGAIINTEEGYSRTSPFLDNKNGLNQFGYWEPNISEIERISGERTIHIKSTLVNQTVFNISSSPNGTLTVKILEDGSISW